MHHSNVLNDILRSLAAFPQQHSPSNPVYQLLKSVARREVEGMFNQDCIDPSVLGDFGPINFPFFRMGAVDTLNLFDLDELILFSFYHENRDLYRKVLDVGANLGLHSLVMSRCGFEVRCFEPDPVHFGKLSENLKVNNCASVTPRQAAVSNSDGTKEFVRVIGNTTGSHLNGSKPSPYGKLDRFPVKVVAIRPLLQWADLVKMDVEGHEADIILSTTPDDWRDTDLLAEIGSVENARAIYDHFSNSCIALFAQKSGWQRVNACSEMPTSYRDGSLFLSTKVEMPWRPVSCGASEIPLSEAG